MEHKEQFSWLKQNVYNDLFFIIFFLFYTSVRWIKNLNAVN